MPEERELIMRFDLNTIEHLGVKMYSQIPTAIAELIANSYDADAKNVKIHLIDDGENKKVIVTDDGVGMTFDEINNEFLVIGRNRRSEGKTRSPSGTRVATGKKGLGKLALFGIGDTIEVVSIKNGQKVHFKMNWNQLKRTTGSEYKPEISNICATTESKGTAIILSDLKRKSRFNEDDLASSLSKLFNFYDSTFRVYVINGDRTIEVTKELRYSEIESEFEFNVSDIIQSMTDEYSPKDEIRGKILTTEKPLKPGLRGITLFANGRLVNAAEFFGRSESSFFYSYATGWIEVDFIDNLPQDVISTNRQSLNWDLDETQNLRTFLQAMVRETEVTWRASREHKTREQISTETKINLKAWYDKLPQDIQMGVEKVVGVVMKREPSTKEERTVAVQTLNTMIPEYPYYHWRHLHEEIKNASTQYYQTQDYYGAFLESVKKYANATRSKSGILHNIGDDDLMAKAFHITSGNLNLTPNYFRTNGQPFPPTTLKNIQEGHFNFSKGVIAGGRNPVAHEEIRDLRESDLFSEKDCLDLLSLLSHLYKRLDNAQLRTP